MLKEKAIPLYYQLETILRRRILSGEFPLDTPLPSEEALGQEYDVSRITVRQALASLEREGLILRRRGKGTFIVEKAVSLESPKLTGFMEDLISMGIKTTAKVLDASMIEAPRVVADQLDAEVAPLLEIRVGDPLLKVKRTVFDLNHKPIEYVSVLYRADKYFFTVRLKRRKSENSVGWRTV